MRINGWQPMKDDSVAGQEVFPDGTVSFLAGDLPWMSPVQRELYRRKTVEEVRRDNPDHPLIKPGPAAPPVTDFSLRGFEKPVYTNNVEQWNHSDLTFEEWISEHYHQDQKGAWHSGGVPDGRRSR